MRLRAVSATARNASTNRMAKIASSIQISVAVIVSPEPGGTPTAADRPSDERRAGRVPSLASRTASYASAWSWPSTCSTPWTTSRASSSSNVPACIGAWARATSGQITTSPRSTGTGPSTDAARSAASRGNDKTSVGPVWPRWASLRAAISARSTNVRVSSPSRPPSRSTAVARRLHRSTSTSTSDCSSAPTTTTCPSVPAVALGGSAFTCAPSYAELA